MYCLKLIPRFDLYHESKKELRIFSILILLFCFAWGAFNAYYHSENVYIHKDPAIYNSAAVWIAKHNNVYVPPTEIFDQSYANPSSSGVAQYGEQKRLYIQGPHYYPILLSMFGNGFGLRAIYAVNAFIGALALGSLFVVARIFTPSRWAFIAPITLGLSLPMIYFSRDTYTEPLTMALAMTTIAYVTLIRKSRSKIAWLFAGVLAGSSTLVRIDAYLFVIAITLTAILLLNNLETFRAKAKVFIGYLLGVVVTSLLSWLDVTLNSAEYYNNLRVQLLSQLILLSVISLIGLPLIHLMRSKSLVKNTIDFFRRRRYFLLGLGVLIFSYIVSRPLWLQTKKVYYNTEYVESLQTLNGLAIDGNQTYAQLSHLWIVWYLGLTTLILGFIGLSALLWKFISSKDWQKYAPITLTAISFSLLYINFPNITPDQIWASRRFLPIIFPMFTIGLVVSLFALSQSMREKSMKILSAAFICTTLVFQTLTGSGFALEHKEFAGFLREIETICDTIPENSVVLLAGPSDKSILFPLKAHCDIESQGINSPTKEQLIESKAAAKRQNKEVVVLLLGHEYDYLPRGSKVSTLSDTPFNELERTLVRRPEKLERYKRVVFLSQIDDDGRLEAYENAEN